MEKQITHLIKKESLNIPSTIRPYRVEFLKKPHPETLEQLAEEKSSGSSDAHDPEKISQATKDSDFENTDF